MIKEEERRKREKKIVC